MIKIWIKRKRKRIKKLKKDRRKFDVDVYLKIYAYLKIIK